MITWIRTLLFRYRLWRVYRKSRVKLPKTQKRIIARFDVYTDFGGINKKVRNVRLFKSDFGMRGKP